MICRFISLAICAELFVASPRLWAEVGMSTNPNTPPTGHVENVNSTRVKLKALTGTLLDKAETGAAVGACSPEVAEAGRFLEQVLFEDTGNSYLEGDPNVVHSRNAGVLNYFSKLAARSPELVRDAEKLKTRIEQLDKENPVTQKTIHFRPHIDYVAKYNAYEEALKITNGNVFKAVSLIGFLGHDDYQFFANGLDNASNLYARQSLGKEVDTDATIRERYRKAALACEGKRLVTKCQGGAEALNYHVNFGFFLGCQLAKRGFGEAKVNRIFVEGMSFVIQDPFVQEDLRCRQVTQGVFPSYCFNLCTDMPKMVGYFYKRTTIGKFLTDDANVLYEQGYRAPFQSNRKEKPFFKPTGWSDDKFQLAVLNIDFRLMHMEYGAEQARAGAVAGAKECSAYKASIEPKDLDTDAKHIFEKGLFSTDLNEHEKKRLGAKLVPNSQEHLKALGQIGINGSPGLEKFGYEDKSAPKTINEMFSLLKENPKVGSFKQISGVYPWSELFGITTIKMLVSNDTELYDFFKKYEHDSEKDSKLLLELVHGTYDLKQRLEVFCKNAVAKDEVYDRVKQILLAKKEEFKPEPNFSTPPLKSGGLKPIPVAPEIGEVKDESVLPKGNIPDDLLGDLILKAFQNDVKKPLIPSDAPVTK